MITLFEHQQTILDKAKDKSEFAFFLETGTGKTILSIENMIYLYRQKKIGAAIVTAPKTVLKPVWEKTLELYIKDFAYYIFQWIGNIHESQNNILNSIFKKDTDPTRFPIFLINIEAFSYNRIYALVEHVMRRWYTLWIMDESTTIKSPATKRTKGILKIAHLAEYKRILSGYPVLKSPEDLYAQIQFLGPHLIPQKSFYGFRNEFCITQQIDNRVTIVKGPKNIEQLNGLIQPFSARVLKKDCLDLPAKLKTIRYVDMTEQQRRYYKQMKEEGYITLKHTEDKVFASTLLVQLNKLHQVANGLLIGNIGDMDCDKYGLLSDLLENEIPDQQVVIWACFVENLFKIEQYLLTRKISCKVVRGAGTESVKIEEDFIRGKFQCLICNPAGFRFGHNWSNASYSIYFNNSFSLEQRIQSEDRLHRIGQRNNVTYVDLVTDNTIEDKILRVLEKNHSVGAAILKDEWEAWFN